MPPGRSPRARLKRDMSVAGKILRGCLIAIGLGILIWSGFEDRDASGAAMLGAISAAALTMFLLRARSHAKGASLPGALLIGALIGALASLLTAALMLFKNLRHAHVYPDFPPEMLLGILERLPHWTLAGALLGLGVALLSAQIHDRRRGQQGD